MISFQLTEQQEKVKAEAAEFARTVVFPRAEEIERTDEAPVDIWSAMAEAPYRYTGMHISQEYGGYPRSLLDQIIIIEEITAVGKSPVSTILMQITGLGTITVINNASEELKKKYLPIVARGEKMASYGLTEPGTGSDAAGIQCRARKERGGYVINGRKRYTSFAHQSAYIILFALTDSEKDNAGISAFLFPTDTPGYRVVDRVPCLGLRGHREEELEFKECWIPEKNLIGEEGKGLSYALRSLDQTRTTLNAGFIGLARACLEEAVKYAKARKTFGKELFHRQALSFPLAEIAARIDAARLMNYEAAWLHDQGRRHTVETAKAKLLATHVMLEAADMAIEVYGGFGCTTREIVERFYRDAKIWSFAQGSPQIMDYIISRDLFGKYEM
ncbi:MAG: acyl-CoA dehydrogenase family protein [Dehalococcoidales bacterium]|nr:acyl-CoA dehydrogenase family protein [Dehalococcoidales bacterium]